MKTSRLYVTDSAKGRKVLVGTIVGDRLIKRVEREKHFFRLENGYAMNSEAILELLNRGVKVIKIIESDTGDVYETTVNWWNKWGKQANYGHGLQIFLNMKYFTLIKEKKEETQDATLDGRLAMLAAWKKSQNKT